MTLTEFLTARLDEDEAAARRAAPGSWEYQDVESVGGGRVCDPTVEIASLHYEQPGTVDPRIRRTVLESEADGTGEHIVRHDPARVLAEVEAKRRIVALYRTSCVTLDENSEDFNDTPEERGAWDALEDVVRLLALPYADHPDWREEWRP